ncbi:ribosomal-protein-alanine acetyltransferase [Sphingomonas sp. Leaf339]|uniref:GNAT family N-acetyltransferase n=1 Tax=Sphingomonas sp. Leaf339 TaxID=1736343 RepID=UPI0006FE8144|nr:GNAT family N-acetyltransferase [Sphingomonas sp. Leaf339]KQU62106.1 ribosomal-protein-alanine acetyltransferase [Sphingomonas sp. Leaf339]
MATRSLILRHGDARDAASIDTVMAAAFDPRYGEAWTRSQCLGVLAMPGVHLTLAFIDDQPAGFSLTRAIAGEAELLLLAVAPGFRRTGVGGTLLRGVIADCQSRDVTILHLEVRADNDAVALYEANGFAKLGERRAYYRGRDGRHYDAHTYSRPI